jgi:hypothetical protein
MTARNKKETPQPEKTTPNRNNAAMCGKITY